MKFSWRARAGAVLAALVCAVVTAGQSEAAGCLEYYCPYADYPNAEDVCGCQVRHRFNQSYGIRRRSSDDHLWYFNVHPPDLPGVARIRTSRGACRRSARWRTSTRTCTC
jgi:hypothetical protein